MDQLLFSQIVDEVLEALPPLFKSELKNLAVIVQDYPELELQHQFSGQLLGLFRGTPQTCQSIFTSPSLPQQIFLYQKNIEALCHSESQLRKQIQKTVKHEIGHYFGLSEQDLRSQGY